MDIIEEYVVYDELKSLQDVVSLAVPIIVFPPRWKHGPIQTLKLQNDMLIFIDLPSLLVISLEYQRVGGNTRSMLLLLVRLPRPHTS